MADRTPGASGEDPEAPRIVDRRKVDPVTGQARVPTPEEAVLAEAEAAVTAGEEEVLLAGVVEAEKLAAERLDQLQRVSADYVNLQTQYSSYVKRSKVEAQAAYDRGVAALAEGLIPVLDDLELARRHGDLTGPFASIAEKLEQILGHFGVTRYGAAGEEFDPAVHDALMHAGAADVTVPTVQEVLQAGYKAGERVLRAARVAVVDPEG